MRLVFKILIVVAILLFFSGIFLLFTFWNSTPSNLTLEELILETGTENRFEAISISNNKMELSLKDSSFSIFLEDRRLIEKKDIVSLYFSYFVDWIENDTGKDIDYFYKNSLSIDISSSGFQGVFQRFDEDEEGNTMEVNRIIMGQELRDETETLEKFKVDDMQVLFHEALHYFTPPVSFDDILLREGFPEYYSVKMVKDFKKAYLPKFNHNYLEEANFLNYEFIVSESNNEKNYVELANSFQLVEIVFISYFIDFEELNQDAIKFIISQNSDKVRVYGNYGGGQQYSTGAYVFEILEKNYGVTFEKASGFYEYALNYEKSFENTKHRNIRTYVFETIHERFNIIDNGDESELEKYEFYSYNFYYEEIFSKLFEDYFGVSVEEVENIISEALIKEYERRN